MCSVYVCLFNLFVCFIIMFIINDQQFNDHTRVCNFQLSDIHVCHCSPNLLHLSQFVTKQTKSKQTNSAETASAV
jgi:hypothetical protein